MAELDRTEIDRRLKAVKAKRGYLLPHHGLLAIASEHLLDAYDAAYTALAIDHKVLSVKDRETVWLTVLISLGEANAPHHVAKFRDGGGDAAEFEAVARLSALVVGAPGYVFLDQQWRAHLPSFDPQEAYARAALHAGAPLSPRVIWLSAVAAHAARGDVALVRYAISQAYRAGVPELELAEALSIMMFPGSVPGFVNAARVWMDMIRAREIEPSPTFAAWANMDGQGGFGQATPKAGN